MGFVGLLALLTLELVRLLLLHLIIASGFLLVLAFLLLLALETKIRERQTRQELPEELAHGS